MTQRPVALLIAYQRWIVDEKIRDWSPSDIRKIAVMRRAAVSFNEIGRTIGKQPRAVRSMFDRLPAHMQ